MDGVMRGITSMIRSMGMGLFTGQMEGSMWGIGRTASSMDGVSTTCPMEIRRLESGWRARKSSGLKRLKLRIRPDRKSKAYDKLGIFNSVYSIINSKLIAFI
jgi:hypothetical protein